jgi:hypothetical protein
VWLRKLGGADVKVNELGPITKVGTGEPQKNLFTVVFVVVTKVYVRPTARNVVAAVGGLQQPYC